MLTLVKVVFSNCNSIGPVLSEISVINPSAGLTRKELSLIEYLIGSLKKIINPDSC